MRLALLIAAATLAALLAGCGSSKSSTQSSTLGDGTYVFHLAGVDFVSVNTSPYFVAGAFTVSKGLITQGEEDFVDFNGVFPQATIDPAQSGIATSADGNLQITLYTGNKGPVILGVNGVQTINATLASSSSARIAEYDASAAGTGSLDLQSSVAQPTGGYAFFAAGLDSNQLPMAMGGIINVDNPSGAGTISGTGSIFDLNDAPRLGVLSGQTFANTSTVSAPDSYGRVVFTLYPSNPSIAAIELVGYIVGSNAIQLVEATGTDGLLGATGGTALSQSSTGTFSPAGSTYVFSGLGQEQVSGQYAAGAGLLDFAGAVTFDSSAGVGGAVSFNDILTQLANGNTNTANWAADSGDMGRISVAGLTTSVSKTPANLEFYLDGNGNALVISMDASDVTAGVAFQQAANPSVSGNYALTADGSTFVTSKGVTVRYPWSAVGTILASTGSATGFTDLNVLANPNVSGTLTPDVTLSGTSSGTGGIMAGTIGGLGYANASHAYVFYVIDNSRALAIETDANQLSEAFAVATSTTK